LVDYFGYKKHFDGLSRNDTNSRPRSRGQPSTNNNVVSPEQPSYVQTLPKEKQAENKLEMIGREDDLVYVSPLLEGFALKNKLWCKFSLFFSSLQLI
jgi:hypothetical protein